MRRSGHRFRTRSDTEVIVHLYEEYGERPGRAPAGACSPSPSGTGPTRRLLLARDRLGIKPLLLLPRRGEAALRLRDQGDPGLSRRAPSGRALGRSRTTWRCGVVPGAAVDLSPAIAQAVRLPTPCWPSRRTLRTASPAVTGSSASSRTTGATPSEWLEALARQTRRGGSPTDRRRAGRRVSERRHRLQRMIVAAAVRWSAAAAPDVLDRASTTRRSASCLTRARWPSSSARGTPSRSSGRTPIELSTIWSRYYDEPFADSSAIPTLLVSRLATTQRQGRPLGRRRRRGLRRLSPVRPRPERGRPARSAARLAAAARPGAAGPRLAEGRLLAPPPALEDRADEPRARPAAAYANTLALCRLPRRRH